MGDRSRPLEISTVSRPWSYCGEPTTLHWLRVPGVSTVFPPWSYCGDNIRRGKGAVLGVSTILQLWSYRGASSTPRISANRCVPRVLRP
jgi:hypothetical protein